jgi:predicted glycoside hydrolase/deacetylase ChbG (UPF0249 family)
MHPTDNPPCLIVNADDYGYFGGVSRGIIEAAARGIVTATGVFANAARFDEDVAALRNCAALDAGVHLNLTDGRPLTPDMRERLSRWGGRFPGKFTLARAVMLGAVRDKDVEVEWRAQIERCLDAGLTLHFLNSHEHIHMLPALFIRVQALAAEYRVPHVRLAAAALARSGGAGGLLRGVIIRVLEPAARHRAAQPVARFLGLEASGRLGLADLDAVTASLLPGGVYELMCHPGHLDRSEVTDPRLLGYHDWEGELAALTDPRAKALLRNRGIRLVGYRDIAVEDGRLVARTEQRQAQGPGEQE